MSTNPTVDALAQALSLRLTALLQDSTGNGPIYAILAPVIPALVEYGVQEGVDAAEDALFGLAESDPYPYWEKLIEAADTTTRIGIMESQRQVAIQEAVQKIEQDKAQAALLAAIINAAILALTAALAGNPTE